MPRKTRHLSGRLIAGDDLHRQPAAGGFAVFGVHIFPGFVHCLDHFIEADARLAGAAQRHPHIFGDAQAGNSAEVLERWEQIKTAERAEKAQHSALDDIPHSLPALMRAHKIQKRCSTVGFDWTTIGPVLDKVYEEIDEVMDEAKQAVVDQARVEEEMGDLLFATVNLSRHLGVKAEVALQKANLKFERRFREVERLVQERGLEMTGVDLETMETIWQQVKRQEHDL